MALIIQAMTSRAPRMRLWESTPIKTKSECRKILKRGTKPKRMKKKKKRQQGDSEVERVTEE